MLKRGVYGILIFILAMVFVIALAVVAFAGGYNPYQLGDKYTTRPHGDGTGAFYTSSTNFCKTCHAVHLAGLVTPPGGYEPGYDLGPAWRLLRATSAGDSCTFCHEGAAPHTNKNAYPLTATNPGEVRGEHSIDNTGPDPTSVGPATGEIPDSNKGSLGVTAKTKGSFPGGVNLTCNACHSVHGAGIIPSSPILREDPYGDGKMRIVDKDVDQSIYGLPYKKNDGTIGYDTSLDALRGVFCADCHNLNPNWIIATNDFRANPHAHPMNTDGFVPVGGVSTKVSDTNVLECKSCHEGTGKSDPLPAVMSVFPHQTPGNKLLEGNYINEPSPLPAGYRDNPQRQLPNLDRICIKCHIWVGGGVGISF